MFLHYCYYISDVFHKFKRKKLMGLVDKIYEIKTTRAALGLMARMVATGHFRQITRKQIRLVMCRITKHFDSLNSAGFAVLMFHIKIGRGFNDSDMRDFLRGNKADMDREMESGTIANKVSILRFLKVLAENVLLIIISFSLFC